MAFLAMLSIPSTMAVFSLDRRPSLRTAAAMAALFPAFMLLTSLIGLAYFVIAILWYLAGQKRPREAASPEWATWARPFLAALVVLPLFALSAHLDPQCTITDADGNVTVTTETNFPTGWNFGWGMTSGTGSSDGTGSRTCVSNTIVWWEAALSIALSAGIVVLASRWPTAESLATSTPTKAVAAEPDIPRISG
jgi:hypothetical protein